MLDSQISIINHLARNKKACDYFDYGTEKRNICDKAYCFNKLTALCECIMRFKLPDYFFIDFPVAVLLVVQKLELEMGFIPLGELSKRVA